MKGNNMLTKKEMESLEEYFKKLLSNPDVAVKAGGSKDAPAEVYLKKEFLGVVYKNEDEGEISYDFNMSILPEDLED